MSLTIKPAFNRLINTETVTIEPKYLGRNLRKYIETRPLKLEGACSSFGWVKPGSIKIIDYDTDGVVALSSLAGYVKHQVTYSADVFVPAQGEVYECVVDHVITQALRAVFTCTDGTTGKQHTLMQILVTRNMVTMTNEVDPANYRPGDRINIMLVKALANRGKRTIDAIGTVTRSPPQYTKESLTLEGVTKHIAVEAVEEVKVSAEDNWADVTKFVDAAQFIDDDDDEAGLQQKDEEVDSEGSSSSDVDDDDDDDADAEGSEEEEDEVEADCVDDDIILSEVEEEVDEVDDE